MSATSKEGGSSALTHHGSAAGGQSRRSYKAGQKSKRENCSDVLGEDCRELKDDKEEKAGNVDGVATKGGHLLQGSEEHYIKRSVHVQIRGGVEQKSKRTRSDSVGRYKKR